VSEYATGRCSEITGEPLSFETALVEGEAATITFAEPRLSTLIADSVGLIVHCRRVSSREIFGQCCCVCQENGERTAAHMQFWPSLNVGISTKEKEKAGSDALTAIICLSKVLT